ncbi:MAG: acetyl-CoA carboxylase carboxyl transferase subunit beta, partial [Crocinitomicaceae bacterium]|nr:acetyl-CoA carboxylase carboxyl transferase subunit beta [Crocinitomicaceae bacterium]
AEPGALIGFAGPRVVRETIGRELPDGFQTSEFVLEHGFLDYIVERQHLKEKLALSLRWFRS